MTNASHLLATQSVGDNLPIVIGEGLLRNVFYSEWGTVHNHRDGELPNTPGAVIIYNPVTGEWHVPGLDDGCPNALRK